MRGHKVRSKKMPTVREAGTGAHVFISVCRWSALGFPGEGQIGQFKPKEQGFGRSHRALI